MRRVEVVSAVVVVGVLVGLLALAWGRLFSPDPAANPQWSQPPALVSLEELGGRQALFDGRAAAGWAIEGPYRVQDGTLELGGSQSVQAVLPQRLEEGEQLEFDFFQEGPAGAQWWVKPVLIDPQPPDPEYCKEFSYDLNLSQFLYRRWHTVQIRAEHKGTNTVVTIETRPHHDGLGKGGGTVHSLPARGGCRHQMVVEVAPGARLFLRNVLLGKASP